MAKAPTQAQLIEQLRADVDALAAKVDAIQKRELNRFRNPETGEDRPKHERPSRQTNDADHLDKSQPVLRAPVKMVRGRDGKPVQRVVRPR